MTDQDIPCIKIYDTTDRIFVHNTIDDYLISIYKNKSEMTKETINILNNININKVLKSFGILGQIDLDISNYLINVSEAKKIASIGNTEIYKIQNVEFIQIDKISSGHCYNIAQNEINILIAGMKKIICEGVFFSRNFDLTNSLQSQKNIKNNNKKNYDIIRHANQKYLFNEPNLRPFFQSEIFSSSILINSIYGYVNSLKDTIKNIEVNYILISRKDVGNLSLQAFSSGYDGNGNISNTVETEQIIIIGQNVFSYLQLRSPPLISSDYFQKISNPELNEEDVKKIESEILKKDLTRLKYHLDELNNNFRFIYITNLLNKDNPQEKKTNEILETHIKSLFQVYQNFKYNYVNFDRIMTTFKENMEKLGQQNVAKKLINDPLEDFLSEPDLQSVLNIFKFFGVTIDSLGSKNHFDQVGIMREICVDGLVRSNIIQMRICWIILEMQFKTLKLNAYEFFGGNMVSVNSYERGGLNSQEFLNNPNKKGIEFIIKMKKLWKENDENLTNLYTGGQGKNSDKTIFNNNSNGNGNLHLKSMDIYLRQNSLEVLTCINPMKINAYGKI